MKVNASTLGRLPLQILDYFIPIKYLRIKHIDIGLRLRITAASALLVIIAFLFLIPFLLKHFGPLFTAIAFLLVPLNALALYLIRKDIRVLVSSLIISLTYSIMNAAIMYFNGGIISAGYLWVLFIALETLFVGGFRAGLLLAVINLTYIFAFFEMNQNGYNFPEYLPASLYHKIEIAMTFLLSGAVAIIGWLFTISRRYAWNEQKKVNNALRDEIKYRKNVERGLNEANTKLDDLNRNLQKEIRDRMEKQRQNESYLAQQSKMIALGEMIGTIAHQWRQPLNSVALIIQDLLEAFKNNELDENYLNKSTNDAMVLIKQMSNTIDDFRSFSRPSEKKIEFDVLRALKETIEISKPMIRYYKIDIDLDLMETAGRQETRFISGYLNEFKHVILNLIMNAKDAVEEKQDSHKHFKGLIHITVNFEKKIVIKIKDNAGGIPDNIIDKIFTPYFTTKKFNKGTGIGLYMAKNIIEQRMGGVILGFNEDEGAVFTIILNPNAS